MDFILITIITILIGVIIYKWGTRDFDYFAKKGIPFPKPTFLIGNSDSILFGKYSFPEDILMQYNMFNHVKVFGVFQMGKPIFYVRDPKIIRQITIKDFDHFTDHRQIFISKAESLFGNSLMMMKGQKWRDMRATLSPAFTGSKMRQMFELISRCGDNMSEYFLSESKKGNNVYEMTEIFGRFATDVIATSAFGLEIDSWDDKDNEFFTMVKRLTASPKRAFVFKFMGKMIIPWIMKILQISVIDKVASEYFRKMIMETMKVREEKGIVRHDMINLLMQVKRGNLSQTTEEEARGAGPDGFATVEESSVGKSLVRREWSDEEIAAQCFLFFIAGQNTISSTLSFLVYELAINMDIQEKLYEEVSDVNESLEGKLLTYEALQNMKYLDMIVSETLRKWPPSLAQDRVCTKDYQYSDEDGVNFTIEKGRAILIPTYAFHHDPNFYPNPDKFDPERFSKENKNKINPSAYVPFGSGPRNCIGSRFALMEVKAIVYYLILNFSVVPNEKTQIPLKFSKRMLRMVTEKGVWLTFNPRK